MKQLLIAGSLAYDYILSYPGMLGASLGQLSTRDGCNITLQARSMGRYFGGCGGNVTYTLALLGERPRLLSIAGLASTIQGRRELDARARPGHDNEERDRRPRRTAALAPPAAPCVPARPKLSLPGLTRA